MAADFPLEIDVRTAHTLQQADDVFLFLDCREREEHALARIPGTVLIPMGELASRLDELESFRARRIVVHCHHGGRSMRVTEWLRRQGFPCVQNLAGGIDAWSQEIDSRVPRY